jgi:D-galactose 1-dehydrogenase
VSPIAIGIVGCGKIARDQHLPAIAESDDFEIVAIADPAFSHDRLPSYPGIAAMVAAHPDVAAVSLCMPPRFRSAAAREALAAGRHVLLEKPPGAAVAEIEALEQLARRAGATLFTAWHSQEAAGVNAARDWLAQASIRSVRVTWKEDVRVWHPGQAWIWEPGGFGVFDPGINALSIVSAILPSELQLCSAELELPANCSTPIAARLALETEGGIPVAAEFDFRQAGPQSWDIDVETDRGALRLSHGGNGLELDGVAQDVGPENEYPALYRRFAALIRAGESSVELAPLRIVEDALTTGRTVTVEPFEE